MQARDIYYMVAKQLEGRVTIVDKYIEIIRFKCKIEGTHGLIDVLIHKI